VTVLGVMLRVVIGTWHAQMTSLSAVVTKIAPAEVEDVLQQHPVVLDAGVVGVPDELRGQVIRAFVVLRRTDAPERAVLQNIRQFIRREIAVYKCPREILTVNVLPRTPAGKLDRRALTMLETDRAVM
jgi:2-aminobenzoate-CoA ligase